MVTQVRRQSLAIDRRDASRHVERISSQGISRGGKVNADLVRTARGDSDLQERAGCASLQDFNLTMRGFSLRACGMDALQDPMGHRTDRGVDGELVLVRATDSQSTIDFKNLAAAPCLKNFRRGRLGHRE
jgi:hypothetical protein